MSFAQKNKGSVTPRMFLAPLFTVIWVPLMVPHLHSDFRAFGRCFGSIWTLFFVHLDVALGPFWTLTFGAFGHYQHFFFFLCIWMLLRVHLDINFWCIWTPFFVHDMLFHGLFNRSSFWDTLR